MRYEHSPTSKQPDTAPERGPGRRRDDQRRAVAEAVVYLRSRRIEVAEDESPEAVVRLLSALGEFERAVNERDGVLLIEGAPSPRSARTRFMLPVRRDDETLREFAARLCGVAKRIDGRVG